VFISLCIKVNKVLYHKTGTDHIWTTYKFICSKIIRYYVV